MKRILHIIILLICGAHVVTSHAATELHFEHIDTHGHAVYCIFRDADGIVWAGTSNGLTTLAQIQSNYPFSYVRHKALNEIIHSISQDNIGRLWIVNNNEHMAIYDARKNLTITDVPVYLKTLGIDGCNEQLTTIDRQGKLWTSNGRNIFSYDFKTKRIEKIALPPNSGPIVALKNGHADIFVCTANNIYVISANSHRAKLIASAPVTLTSPRITIERDINHNLWVGINEMLFCQLASKKKWEQLRDVHHVKSIVTTPSGRTYVGTSNYGLFVFNNADQPPTNLKQAPPNSDGLQNNHIESLYFDEYSQAIVVSYNKSNLSIGTQQNERYAIHRLATAANQYQPEDVISFAADADGHSFWAGTEDGGLFRIDGQGSFSILENQYRGHTITSLFTDSHKHLWIGRYAEGLFAHEAQRFYKEGSPYSILQPNAEGPLFVALLGQGIVALNPKTGETKRIETDNPWIVDMAQHNGRLYAVTNDFIYEVSPTLQTKRIPINVLGKETLLKEGHRDLYADRRGWLWMVPNVNHSPLYIYDPATGKSHTLSEMQKYIIYSICADKEDNIWCATDQGMVRISTDGKQFAFNKYIFNMRHDYNYNSRALYTLPNGLMVAGTNKGFIHFNPLLLARESKKDMLQQPPIITLLRINSQPQTPSQLNADIFYTRELNLEHEEKNFVIECRPRGFTTEVGNRYYFMLKGFSDQWMPLSNNNIILSNLPPGHYDLYVRSSIAAEEEAPTFHMLRINIRQPFWLSAWGFVLYLVALALLSWGLYKYLKNRQQYRREISKIEQQKQREEELSEMKTRFFTNVSHDLRTPLSLIIAPIDELIERFSKQPKADNTLFMLNTMKRNANRLLTLVNQVLDIRRLEIAGDQLNIDATDVKQIVSDIATAFTSAAQQHDITLAVDVPPEPLIMATDKEKLSKIINNLVSNSFKFTPDGGSISISCLTQQQAEGTRLQLSIADTGKGISEKELPHIFERYYYSRQLKTSHESSGIGLSIVKQYVELMQGSISVAPNTPHGTIFTVSLPFAPAHLTPLTSECIRENEDTEDHGHENATGLQDSPQVNKHTPPLAHDGIGNAAQAATRPTILLADDNADLLSFIAASLADDYHIITATTGQEALQLLGSDKGDIDVIVSDIMMPDIDGLELTRRIKNNVNLSHIPVILLTAKALEEDQLRGLQMGANDYITKPFNTQILRLRINSWMQRRQAVRSQFSGHSDVEPEKVTITTLDQQLLQQTISAVNQHMHEPDFNVDQLAAIIGIHRTGLNRKLQFITGMSPMHFLRKMRMKRAHQLISDDPSQPVAQVAYQVGFNNPKIFARYFQEEYGIRPSEMARQMSAPQSPS